MVQLARRDLRLALDCTESIADAAEDVEALGRRGADVLARAIGSDLTTLSVCDLGSCRRRVVCRSGERLSARDLAAFDAHFDEHPLLQLHATRGGSDVRRIADAQSRGEFRRSGLYADYYRPIGIERVVALPLLVDRQRLVGFVLNRSGREFSARDVVLLELMRRPLSRACRPLFLAGWAPLPASRLTRREDEILHWLAAGKANAQIADILRISRRTVEKHLERIYEKLGVETRTAAALRAGRYSFTAPVIPAT